MSNMYVNVLYQRMLLRRLNMRRRTGSRQYRGLFSEKYKIQFGDAQIDLKEGVGNSA